MLAPPSQIIGGGACPPPPWPPSSYAYEFGLPKRTTVEFIHASLTNASQILSVTSITWKLSSGMPWHDQINVHVSDYSPFKIQTPMYAWLALKTNYLGTLEFPY